MTAENAISRLDREVPNRFAVAEKLEWLTGLEGELCREVFSPFKDPPPLRESLSPGDTLSAPAPYDSLYLYGMEAVIHRLSGDMARYKNAAVLYNECFDALRRYWIRTHEAVESNILHL